MTDEFVTVRRKKWICRKNTRIASLQKSLKDAKTLEDSEQDQVDPDKLEERIKRHLEQMKATQYFTNAMSTLDDSLAALNHTNVETPKRIVCLGIGPFSRSFQAMHQLAFILCARQQHNIEEVNFYDPILCPAELEVLERFNCYIMKQNCEGKHGADVLTLYYLPHCTSGLTNNLLWANWRRERLSNIILICNSFKFLVDSKPERFMLKNSRYILNVLPYLKELQLEDNFQPVNVFNDISIHVFPGQNLPEETSEYWLKLPAPTYDDDELILGEKHKS